MVVHLLATAAPAGASITAFVRDLAIHADPHRYALAAWFLIEDGELAGELTRAGVAARFIPWQGRRDPLGGLSVVKELQCVRARIVHRHTGGRSVGLGLRAMTRARLVGHVHGTTSEVDGQPAHAVTYGAHAVVANSEAAALASRARNARVIYPAVDLARFDTSRHDGPRHHGPEDAYVFGTASRLVPAKGLGNLLEAFAAVRAEAPSVRLEVAGDGPGRAALVARARRLGVADHVRFLGWRTDLPTIFASWDVFVQASSFEGFGLSALEAMAAGLPVVATAVGGVPEVVDDAKTGVLVGSGDVPALTRALLTMVRFPDRAHAMGVMGRARAARLFRTERLARQTFDLYDELLRRPGQVGSLPRGYRLAS